MKKHEAPLIVLLVLCLDVSAAAGQQWDPFPDLSPGRRAAAAPGVGAGVAVELEQCLQGIRSAVGARYYGAVVNVSAANGSPDPELSNAVPYVDALYQAWRGGLDAERHVLMVISLKNRGVAIHPGISWVDLGFTGQAITRAIDESDFGKYARGGDYAQALCALARGVDQELAKLTAEVQDSRRQLADQLADLQQGSNDLEVRVAGLEVSAAMRDTFRRQLEELGQSLAGARSLLDQERLGAVGPAVERVGDQLTRTRRQIDDVEAALRELGPLRDQIDQQRASTRGAFLAAAAAVLDRCAQQTAAVAKDLEDGVPTSLGGVRQCLAEHQREVRSAATTSFVVFRLLPLVLVALGLVFIYGQRRVRNRARQAMHEELERWRGRLANASERLLDLERRFPLYFALGSRRWKGASQKLDQECADAVNLLHLLYSRAFELRDRAEQEAERIGETRLFSAPYTAVVKMLRDTPVCFETGEAEPRRRIFLPLQREFKGTAAQVVDALEATYADAVERLEGAEALEARAQEISRQVDETLATLQQDVSARADLGMPVEALEEELEELAERHRAATAESSDPLTGVRLLEELAEPLATLGGRTRSGNQVADRLRGPVRELGQRLRAEVGRLRENGFELREPGFQPDLVLDRSARESDRILDLVATRQEAEAERRLADLERLLAELGEQMAASERARDGVPGRVEELADATARLRRRIPEGRTALEAMRSEHALEAFLPSSDNLEELATLLAQVDSTLGQIRDDHAAQRYLSALADVAEVEELLAVGNGLIDEIGEARSMLAAARDRSRQLAHSCSDAVAQSERLEGAAGVDPTLRGELAAWRDQVQEEMAKIDDPQPNWPRICARLDDLARGQQVLRQRAETDVASFRRCRDLEGGLRTFLDDLERKVAAEHRDRPFVAEAVREARGLFNAWRGELERGELGGGELERRGREVRTAADQAYNVWTSEMQAIQQAQVEIERAAALVGSCSDREARGALEEARRLSGAQLWEEALKQALLAGRMATTAIERRRAEAAVRRARTYASSSSSRASRSTPSFSIRSGGSRSGGLSFGSSSGGSSFRSSNSGGSSW